MSKQSADRSRAARAAALLEEQRRREARRRTTLVAGVAAVLVALVVAGYVGLSGRDTTGATAPTPSGMSDSYGVLVGDDAAPTTLTFYEDPQCPVCADFESEVGGDVADAVSAGDVKVEYRVVSFLDHASENEYSSRAANALMVVQDTTGAGAFAELHRILYENQPAEGTAGPDDEQLIAWAVEAGADEADVRAGIESGAFDQFVENATDQMSKDGVKSTPTVFVDGQQTEGDPVVAVQAALG